MKKTGGSAFPQANHDAYGMGPGTIDDTQVFDVQGMTLRDWFAGMAMQAILSNPSLDLLSPNKLAHDAFNAADAMIEERSQP